MAIVFIGSVGILVGIVVGLVDLRQTDMHRNDVAHRSFFVVLVPECGMNFSNVAHSTM